MTSVSDLHGVRACTQGGIRACNSHSKNMALTVKMGDMSRPNKGCSYTAHVQHPPVQTAHLDLMEASTPSEVPAPRTGGRRYTYDSSASKSGRSMARCSWYKSENTHVYKSEIA